MAKRGRPKKNNKEKKKEEEKQLLSLDPETRRGIVVVALFTLAVLIILSFADWAGRFGSYINEYSGLLFGKGKLLLPAILIISGLIIVKYIHKKVYLPVALGSVIFILGFLSLFNILFPETQKGGYIGYLVSQPFIYLLGKWAAFIVLSAIILISILIAFNIPLKRNNKKEKTEYPDEIEASLKEAETISKKRIGSSKGFKNILPKPKFKVKNLDNKKDKSSTPKELEENIITPISAPPISDYKFPPLKLLGEDKGSPSSGDIRLNASIIKKTLENFNIKVEMGEVSIGPTVTQYTLRPASGIKLSKITSLQKDLSLALAAHPIRVEAPIPGRSLVGIEIPNRAVTLVKLRNLLEGIDLRKDPSKLNLVLGRNVAGEPVWSDLTKMPHLLVAGATGSGKSICINSLLITLLYQKTPEELKFILMDPKRVELPRYNDIPHLLTPVITDVSKTVNALKWAIGEMEKRYEVLAQYKCRDIFSYNQKTKQKQQLEKFPYIVIVIDELADIMSAFGKEVEGAIIRLAQMSRAVGIHLIVSTQRPSVEVITGLIKANITSRIAFQVASQVDSRTILDVSGAEKLLGNGDMLFLSGETAYPKRIQGAFTSEKEVKNIIKFIKEEKDPDYQEKITTPHLDKKNSLEKITTDDPLYQEAKELVIRAGKASASYLQRRLQIGYARAARILDMLEENQIISSSKGAKPRDILVSQEEEEPESNL